MSKFAPPNWKPVGSHSPYISREDLTHAQCPSCGKVYAFMHHREPALNEVGYAIFEADCGAKITIESPNIASLYFNNEYLTLIEYGKYDFM